MWRVLKRVLWSCEYIYMFLFSRSPSGVSGSVWEEGVIGLR